MQLDNLPPDYVGVKPVSVRGSRPDEPWKGDGSVDFRLIALLVLGVLTVVFALACMLPTFDEVDRIRVARAKETAAAADVAVSESESAAAAAAAEPMLVLRSLAFLDDRAVVTFEIWNSPRESEKVSVSLEDADGEAIISDSRVAYTVAYGICPDESGFAEVIADVPVCGDSIGRCASVRVRAQGWFKGVSEVSRTDLVESAKAAYFGS